MNPAPMRAILFLLLSFSCVQIVAQDTIYATPKHSLPVKLSDKEIPTMEPNLYSCAHGHECCSAGCSCCGALHREQLYDTIYYPLEGDIQRITVVERYYFAQSNDLLPVHYRFRKDGGNWSQKYYCAGVDREDGTTFLEEGIARYSKDLEKNYRKTNSILVIDESGDFSTIDQQGNPAPVPFHSNERISEGVYLSSIIVNNEQIYGFSDGKGNKIGPLKYLDIGTFDQYGLAHATAYTKEPEMIYPRRPYFGKAEGVVNAKGEEVFPCVYHELRELGLGRFVAKTEDGAAIMLGEEDTLVMPWENYRYIQPFSTGDLAYAQKEEDKGAYLDINGNAIVEVKALWGRNFHDGRAAVSDGKLYGYIDDSGKPIIDFRFTEAYDFIDGVAIVKMGSHRDNPDTKWHLIDENGKNLATLEYAHVEQLKDGFARVAIAGKGTGMMDAKGKEIFPCNYVLGGQGTKDSWFVDGKLIRSTYGKDSSLELVNEQGKQVLSLHQYAAADFLIKEYNYNTSYPYIRVLRKSGGEFNLIDFNGKELLQKDYKTITPFSNKTVMVMEDDNTLIVDIPSGKPIKTFPSGHWVSISHGIIKVEIKKENGYYRYEYYNMNGELLETF